MKERKNGLKVVLKNLVSWSESCEDSLQGRGIRNRERGVTLDVKATLKCFEC